VIQREVILRLLLKILQHAFVVDVYPARGVYIDCFELAIDSIFVLQSMCNHFELQRPDCTQYQVVFSEWSK